MGPQAKYKTSSPKNTIIHNGYTDQLCSYNRWFIKQLFPTTAMHSIKQKNTDKSP